MLSFLLGLGAGAIVVLDPKGTRRLLATILAKGQELLLAATDEATRVTHQVGEELSDIVAEARSEYDKTK
jgi:hypothetical protein